MQMVMTTLSHNTYLRVPSQLGSLDRHKAKLPHIRHLIDSGGIYGIERMLLALLPEMQVLGYTVALGCFGMPDMQSGAVGQAATELGIETLFFNFRSGASLTGVARVMQAIARSRQTILHFHGYKATIIGGIAAQLFRRIGVATYHGEASQAVGLRRQIAVESPIIRQLTAVVAVSEPMADELRRRHHRCELADDGRLNRNLPSKTYRLARFTMVSRNSNSPEQLGRDPADDCRLVTMEVQDRLPATRDRLHNTSNAGQARA